MSFLWTLLRPDHEEHPDRGQAAHAANLIQVGEFQLIQLAYFEWFGDELPEATGNRLFQSYMVKNEVPHWVRHFARRIIVLERAGQLDDRDPAYHRYDAHALRPVDDGTRRFVIAAAVVAVCVLGGLWAGYQLTEEGTSVLPPYFSEEEMRRSR